MLANWQKTEDPLLPMQEHGMNRYKQGSPSYCLIVLLSISMALIGCSQASTPAHTPTVGADAVTSWIGHNALPLKTVEPGGSDADLLPLGPLVGNASIVGLGEATHGTHEFFAIKARIVEFLISHLGFTTFIMENNWGSSRLVDAYINGGSETIGDVMQQSLFPAWQTQEYRDMLAWIRAYNTSPTHPTKIHFFGMDMQQDSQGDFNEVATYVHLVDPRQDALIQSLYSQDQAQQLYNLLLAHQQAYEQRSSPQAFALVLHTARVILQYTIYNSQQRLPAYIQRDAFMAENVAWINDHAAGSRPKLIVWAHDVHIANNTAYFPQNAPKGTENIGGYLRKWYHDNYLNIATSLYQEVYNIYPSYGSPNTTALPGTPGKDTYNYTLGKVSIPLYLLDLRKTPPGPVTDWANRPHIFLEYGLQGVDLSVPGSLQQWFNIIVFIRNTTPSHSLLS
jgi:erythromycin esterase